MAGESRVRAMNAMSVFRDQCAVSWDVNTFTSGGTIAPATSSRTLKQQHPSTI